MKLGGAEGGRGDDASKGDGSSDVEGEDENAVNSPNSDNAKLAYVGVTALFPWAAAEDASAAVVVILGGGGRVERDLRWSPCERWGRRMLEDRRV